MIAVDPGRVAIATCGEWVTDKVTGRPRWATWRLSRSEFYAKTGYTESMHKRSLWNLEVADAHAALATVSVRTGRLDRFDAFLAVVETHLDDLWTNREHSRWMRLVRAPPGPPPFCILGSGIHHLLVMYLFTPNLSIINCHPRLLSRITTSDTDFQVTHTG